MENTLITTRLQELAKRSFDNNQYTFTSFLNISELSEFYRIKNELSFASPTVFGGYDPAERCIVRFGNPDEFGYEEQFPIAVLEAVPLMAKFSDDLNHRDFLGAVMNLGIERNILGDIIVKEKRAYIFCLESMADYICENLTRIKHTSVSVKRCEAPDEIFKPKFEDRMIQVSSARIDAVIAKTFNFSRNVTVPMFMRGLVFLNGKECTENSKSLKPGDTISVRGHGKFVFEGPVNTSKKGKENCKIKIYV